MKDDATIEKISGHVAGENARRGTKNLVYSVLGQAVTILVGMFLPHFIILKYGSSVNGALNSVNQVFAYFVLLEAGIGAASLQSLYMPVSGGDSRSISAIMSATRRYYSRTAKLYLAAIAVFAAVFSAFFTDESVNAVQMAGIIVFSGLGNVLNFWYQGRYKILMQAEGKKYVISNVQTVTQLLVCAAKLAGIAAGCDIAMVMFLGFIVTMTQTFWYMWYIRRSYGWLDEEAAPDYAAVSKKNAVLVHSLSQLIFQNTDILLLTVVSGFKVVSVYSVYKLVVAAVSGVTYQISESLTFVLGQKYASDRAGYEKRIDAFDVFYTAVTHTLFTITIIMYPSFIDLYTRGASDIAYADPYLPLLFVAIELLSSWRILLVGRFGMYGVLTGTIVALLYRTNDIIIYANRRLLKRSPVKSYRIYAAFTAVFAVFFAVSRAVPAAFASVGWLDFFAKCALCLCVTAAAYSALSFTVFKEQVRPITEMLRRLR